MNYQVKQGKVIYHADQKYSEGQEVELDAAQALIHAENIEVIDSSSTLKETPVLSGAETIETATTIIDTAESGNV